MPRESMGRKMNKEKVQIDFYRTSAVHSVLKRYEFTEDEKKVIHAAIRTAVTKHPNMQLIAKADALLNEIASSREPIKQEVDPTELVKAKARAAIVDTHTKRVKAEQGSKGLGLTLLAVIIPGLIVAVVYKYAMNDESRFSNLVGSSYSPMKEPPKLSFAEAKAYCTEKKKLLPMTFEDAPNQLEIPNEYNNEGYWRANGEVIYNIAKYYGERPELDTQKHYVLCVQTNNKRGAEVRF